MRNSIHDPARRRPRSRVVAALALAGALFLSAAPTAMAKDASGPAIGEADTSSSRAVCWVIGESGKCIEHAGTCGDIGMTHGVEVGGATCYDYWA